MLTLCSSCKGGGARKGRCSVRGRSPEGVGPGKEEGEGEGEGPGRGRGQKGAVFSKGEEPGRGGARKGGGGGRRGGAREGEGSGRGRKCSVGPPHTSHTQTCAKGRKQVCRAYREQEHSGHAWNWLMEQLTSHGYAVGLAC